MDKLADIAAAGLTEGLKETVEEDLRLPFLSPVMCFCDHATNSASFSRLGMGGFYRETV